MPMSARILIALLMALSLGLPACKTSGGSSHNKDSLDQTSPLANGTTSTDAADEVGNLRIIHTLAWPGSWGQFLVGVGENGEALVRLEQTGKSPRLAFALVNLSSGDLIEQWEASSTRASSMIAGYPGFRGMQGGFEEDLAKYASWLARVGPWTHHETTPPFGVHVSPDGEHIIYSQQPDDGRDGDWLMLADADGKRLRRFDDGLRASYNANFSPDGEHVAWMGGSRDYARPGKQVGYVLRVASVTGKMWDVPQVRDEIRTPIWSRDGSRVWAIGKRGRNERCLFSVELSTRAVDALHCFDGLLDPMLSPDGNRMLLMLSPDGGSEAREVVLLDLKSGLEEGRFSVPGATGMGRFGEWIDNQTAVFFARADSALQIIRPSTGEILHEVDLSSAGKIRGRLGAGIYGDEMILLRQPSGSSDVQVIGVRVRD